MLLNAPDITTLRGLRDRRLLSSSAAVSAGPKSPRSRSRTFSSGKAAGASWIGKHGRIRTTPMPNWVKVAIGMDGSRRGHGGTRFSSGRITATASPGDGLGEKVVWQMLREYASAQTTERYLGSKQDLVFTCNN